MLKKNPAQSTGGMGQTNANSKTIVFPDTLLDDRHSGIDGGITMEVEAFIPK